MLPFFDDPRYIIGALAVISGLVTTFLLDKLGPNLWHAIRQMIPSERKKGGRPPAAKSPFFYVLLVLFALVAVLTTAYASTTPPDLKQISVIVGSPTVFPSPSESPTEGQTEISNVTATNVVPVTKATSTLIAPASAYYLEHPFGCRPGTEWQHNEEACPSVELKISLADGTSNLQLCKQYANPGNCPKHLPVTQLDSTLEWRFRLYNSSSGSVQVRPIVVIGNSSQGQIGLSVCTIGRTDFVVQPTEENTQNWYELNGRLFTSIYCALPPLDYHLAEWSTAVVDYEVEGTRYYVAQSYVP